MELIRIHEANSHHHAQILQGLLASAGFDAHVEGGELMDEFASATKLAGGFSGVLVPEDQAEAAKAFLDDYLAQQAKANEADA
jgi:hypothetical protein